MLILSRGDVEALLDLDSLIESLADAMADLSAGRASAPPRVGAFVPGGAMLAAMPGYVPSLAALETKLVSLFPGNAHGPLPTHQAVIVTFDPANGTPLALLDGTYITAMRTAAGSALATKLLAREDSRTVAILGTGVQARAHAIAVSRVLPGATIRVAGRDINKAQTLARELRERDRLDASAVENFEAAMQGADCVYATTHADRPVIRRAWVEPGMHLSSIGYNVAGREVDGETVRDACLFVESRNAALAPMPAGAPDILRAIEDGLIGPDHIQAEIGEIVLGTHPGRRSPAEVTLYKSVGVAVQDAAAATLVVAAARERRGGREVEL